LIDSSALIALTLASLLGLTACSDDPADAAGDLTDAGSGSAPSFPAVTDFSAPGPFATTTGPSPADCTVFRPQDLGEEERLHPVILWGNGTATNPQIYAEVLTHWASHGFIVAAANTSNAGTGKEMLSCLAYLEEQHAGTDNPYAGHVALDRVGSSGHSQGGAGAIMVGADPRVSVTAPLQPYIHPIPNGGAFDMKTIGEQTGPMFLMSGTADTIATPERNQEPVFASTNAPVFWGNLVDGNHIVTAIGNISDYRGPATAWLRLHLMNDESARKLFYGESCVLCGDAKWQVQRKNLD